MRRRFAFPLLVIVLLVAAFAHAPAASAQVVPATRVVDDDQKAAPGNCAAETPTTSSIQAAVADSEAGDTILVCPGVYPDPVDVDVSVTIQGAQGGVDARTRDVAEQQESVVLNGFSVTADGVTIDGFTIRNAARPGISLRGDTAGHDLVNNIVRNNVFGIYLNSDGEAPTTVQFNRIEDNNIGFGVEAASGNGIYSDQGLVDVLVDRNVFRGHMNAAAVLVGKGSACPSCGPVTDVTFSQNDLGADRGVSLFAARRTRLEDNSSAGSDTSVFHLGGANRGITVVGNTVSGSAGAAVAVDDLLGFGPNGRITVKQNDLSGNVHGVRAHENALDDSLNVLRNRITGSSGAGILNESDVVVNGVRNWWGDPSGPSDWGIGTGDAVSAEVDFFPWALDTSTRRLRRCDQTAADVGATLTGDDGSNVLCGGPGDDTLRGGLGDDLLLGMGGVDLLRGHSGDDALIGHADGDDLGGQAGFDSLQGRDGTDRCGVGPGGGQRSSCE